MTAAWSALHGFELSVVRHGRTAWNADGRFQGHTDVPLDALGREQARALALSLRDERYDALVSSDLARARETADILASRRGLPLRLDPRWREMRFGAWEGLTWAQIVEREPRLAGASLADPAGYAARGGEAFDDVCERVAQGLGAIDAELADGARVLVVTHAGPLHALLRVALGQSAATALQVRFTPASVTRLEFGQGGNRVLELNRTAEPFAAGRGAESG